MTEHKSIPWQVPDTSFHALHVPKREQTNMLQGYRVFSSATEYKDVEAESVGEAITKSGIAQPLKLEKLGLVSVNVYPSGALKHLSGYGSEQRMEDVMQKSAAQAAAADSATPAAEAEKQESAGQEQES